MGILAPYMLAGLALASVPIVIHLLNRRRFVLIDWAPMKYLKLTLKVNRRRLHIEQILLLIVRTLIIILLFLALGRFVVSGNAFGSLFAIRERSARVIVIDDSLSMGYAASGESAFDRARAVAADLIERTGSKDSTTVFATSMPAAPLARHARIEDPTSILATISGMTPSHAASHWMTTFKTVETHLQDTEFPIQEVILITDLRRFGWEEQLVSITDAWSARGVTLRIVDVGETQTDNVVLEALEPRTPVPLIDMDVSLRALVRNDGPELLTGVEAMLHLDESTRSVLLPDIPPGQAVNVPLSLRFQSPGQHAVSLVLPGDALKQDSVRYRVMNVGSQLNIVTVDGEPGSRPFTGEMDFLALALSVGNLPWRVTQTIDSEWLNKPLDAPDVLVLANVSSMSPARVDALERMVEAGMGLMIFPGEQVDRDMYNDIFYRNGQGLLPAKFDQTRDESMSGLIVESLTESPLESLSELPRESLAGIRVERHLRVDVPDDDSGETRVLARWNDASRSPAVIEKRFGRGRVLLWTVTADKQWSEWPTDPSYVLTMRKSISGIAAQRSTGENVTSGESLHYQFDALGVPTHVTVLTPGSDAPVAVSIDQSDPEAVRVSHDQTRLAGRYDLTWHQEGASATATRLFAVNPDTRESRLERISHDALQRIMGSLAFDINWYAGKSMEFSSQNAELWRFLIVAMLVCICSESLLAAWIGRER